MNLFTFIILMISVIAHEVAHGIAAFALGDETAKRAGRLTLNPLPHIDIMGTILIPLLLLSTSSPIFFGYAKPVPVNLYNLKNQRWGETIVAFAGPFVNIIIFIIALFIYKTTNNQLFMYISLINIILALFNLLPIPPLDGSKIATGLFPKTYIRFREFFENKGFIFQLIFILLIWNFVGNIIMNLIYPLFT